MTRFIIHHSSFIILLCSLLLSPPTQAASSGSFTITLQSDGYFGKTNTTTWSGTRGAATSNASNTTADSLMTAVGFSTPNYLAHRIRIHTDSLNADQATYDDSLELATPNDLQLDSLVLSLYLLSVVDNGGCSGYLYAHVFDTCAAGSRNYSPGTYTPIGYFNDIWTPDGTLNSPALFDSVATTNGQAAGRVTFAIADRTILDEIECLMQLNNAGIPQALRFEIVTCYDQSNTDPGTTNLYQYKAAVASLEATAANRPTLTAYWSESATPLPWHSANPFSRYPFSTLPFNR